MLPQKTFQQLVADMVTAWSNQIGVVPTLNTGDALLAIFQSVSSQLDYLQSQVTLVNAVARAQTSSGADLDTWMAQFQFFREPATFAEGPVTFTKLVPATSQILIPAGTIVQTTGGAIQYVVIADTAQPTWSATYNAYVLAIGQSSLVASVQASVAGSGSNVSVGQLNQIASSLPGIDQVNNGAPISNGIDAQSDDAFRTAFISYLGSLAQGTYQAILTAAQSVQQGLQVDPIENIKPNGDAQLGAFTVFVDNGTGSPPSPLLDLIFTAVNAVRAFTVQPYVSGPGVVTGVIDLNVRLASGANSGVVTAAVQNAIIAYVNSLAIGGTLFISSLEGVALTTSGVTAVQPDNTTINSAQADLIPTDIQAIRTASIHVSVGTY